MAFKIVDPDRFATVMEFALAAGVADKLIKRLEYLARYGDGGNVCHLHNDFAPHSFEYLMLPAGWVSLVQWLPDLQRPPPAA